jgi:hypothetical protein
MAIVLNEVAAMIATEVNRLIRMSASYENCVPLTREGKQPGITMSRPENCLVANRDLNATPIRYRMEQACAGRRIGPIGR